MKLWPNAWVVIERSHANRHLGTLWPIPTKEAGTAVDAKGFHRALSFSVNANKAFAL